MSKIIILSALAEPGITLKQKETKPYKGSVSMARYIMHTVVKPAAIT